MADVSMENFLLQYFMQLRIKKMPAEIMAKYQEYLGKVNALRERFADILLTGRFNSTLGYVIDEPQIRSNAFLLEDRMAVVLTHRREEELSVAVHVPGYHFVRMDSARGDARLENGRLFLPEYSLCVMLYRKNGC